MLYEFEKVKVKVTDNELLHLIKMINHIADNLDYDGGETEVALRVLEHIDRFWAPSMKLKIVEYAEVDGSGLSSISKLAITSMS